MRRLARLPGAPGAGRVQPRISAMIADAVRNSENKSPEKGSAARMSSAPRQGDLRRSSANGSASSTHAIIEMEARDLEHARRIVIRQEDGDRRADSGDDPLIAPNAAASLRSQPRLTAKGALDALDLAPAEPPHRCTTHPIGERDGVKPDPGMPRQGR